MQQYALEQLVYFFPSAWLSFILPGRVTLAIRELLVPLHSSQFGSQRPSISHHLMSQRPASPASLPKRGERQSSRLAEKSDDPLAEDATTAEIAVSQQAAPNTQPTFSANPADIGFGRIALGEAPISTPSFSPVQVAHETASKFALLKNHVTKLFQQEKVKLGAYCCNDGNLLDSVSILFTTWDKHPLTSQTDIFVSPPAPYQQAAPLGSLHLHVDASGNIFVSSSRGLLRSEAHGPSRVQWYTLCSLRSGTTL
jgi:hypothetical protein